MGETDSDFSNQEVIIEAYLLGKISRDEALKALGVEKLEEIEYQRDALIRDVEWGLGREHPGFGIWAERKDITDSATFAEELRRRIEKREDGGKSGIMNKYQCPCCGNYTLDERGKYEICPVCFWEDDNAKKVYGQPAPERPEGPNHVQLSQARENYQRFGYAEERNRSHVRQPRPDELPENNK